MLSRRLLPLLLTLLFVGCADIRGPLSPISSPVIAKYTTPYIASYRTPGSVSKMPVPGSPSLRKGKACMQNIFGLIAWGDASIPAAKAQGKIDQVVWVDHMRARAAGYYSRFCTLVYGFSKPLNTPTKK